jgi:ABC-2 type transport system ATP-binding protein
MTTPMVEVTNLVKTYVQRHDGKEIRAVKGISLTIGKGEIFSLLGPNGAGKTTTISMISGLIAPTSGDAKIGGFSITQHAMEAKKLLGVIPQEIALYQELSPRQNLEFFGKMYNLSGNELHKRVDEVLDFVDLKDRSKDRINTFSGGMKRRVNIAVGLLHRPQLVYMDEPTVGIDPQNRRRILDTVLRLRDESKMTVLYTTHLMEEAEELSNRVGIIDHGEIIAIGTTGELVQQVGEEDRLVFHVGEQTIENALIQRLQTSQEGITRVLYDAPQQVNEDSTVATEGKITVFAKRGRKALPHIITTLDTANIEIQSVEVREPDLEAVFLQLTGRALRD